VIHLFPFLQLISTFFHLSFPDLPRQGLKKAFLRLAGLAIAESAVTLNWACAGDALAQINSKLRRLAEAVRLCFEIEIEGLSGEGRMCKWYISHYIPAML
jgi:hypothetical protein